MMSRLFISTKVTKSTKPVGMASGHTESALPFFETFVSFVVKQLGCDVESGRT